jgi:antitoxin (DNA-binding transcriptional repressor) of toxin-antitoxin stability system
MLAVSKSQFKARALEFFRQVEATGESIVITDHGQRTLELRPYQAPAHDPLDLLRGSVLRYDDPTEPIGDDHWEALR